MVLNLENEEDGYKIVTWAANTTGNPEENELCELSAYTPESNFERYLMPYYDVKPTYWKWHHLRECNGQKLRYLINYKTSRHLNTKTELCGLQDFLLWLQKINGESSNGVVLICFDHYNRIHEILLQCLNRCNLYQQFSLIVKGFVNCFDICTKECGTDLKEVTLNNVSKLLFKEDITFIRALPSAKVCYRIITHFSTGNELQVDQEQGSSLFHFIKSYIQNTTLQVPESTNKIQASMENLEVTEVTNTSHQTKAEQKLNKKAQRKSKVDKAYEQLGFIDDSKLKSYCKYDIIPLAVNSTGCLLNDGIYQIAAISSNSKFNQFIVPSKCTRRSYYKSKISTTTVNGIRYLKDFETQQILDTKSEADSVEDFIMWLEKAKKEQSEGIVLLYHERQKHSVMILLETLKRWNLTEKFANLVKGFINLYPILENTCTDIAESFSLNMMSHVLFQKNTIIRDALIRAHLSYEIIKALIGRAQKEPRLKNISDIIEKDKLEFLKPYISTLDKEKDEIADFKMTSNRKKNVKTKKRSVVKPNLNVNQEIDHNKNV